MSKAFGKKYKSEQYIPDSSSYTFDQSAAKDANNARQESVDNRATPESQAAQTDLSQLYQAQLQNAQVAQSQGVQLSPAERANAAQIGRTNLAQGVNVGQAAQSQAAQLNSQDAQFRQGQTNLMNQLTAQANGQGPSLAGSQYQQAQEANLKGQMGAAAAMGGRNAGLAQRQLAMNAASQGQQTARDVANIRTQEQLSAQGQLANVAQTGRSQDIDLASQNAQLQQQASLANQSATNQFGLTQAQMNLQNNQFNSSALNSRQDAQAQLNQQAALANQQYGNQFALQQGQMNLQNNQYNSAAQNQAYLQNAQLNAANQANYQSQYNQTLGQNTANNQQTNLANQQAEFQNRAQQDAMTQYLNQANAQLDARQQDALLQFESDKIGASSQRDAINSGAYKDAADKQSSLLGTAVGAAASFYTGGASSAMSDINSKTDIDSKKRGNAKMAEFLGSMSSTSDENAKDTSPEKKNEPAQIPVYQAPVNVAPVPTAPVATTTAPVASTPEISSSDKSLRQENDKLKAIVAGMGVNNNQPTTNPGGFAGGALAGSQLASNLVSGYYKGKIAKNEANLTDLKLAQAKQNAAPPAKTGFSGASDLGGTAPVNVQGGGSGSMFGGMQGSAPVQAAPAMDLNLQETSDENAKDLSAVSHSPIGGKTGISDGNMQMGNFLNALTLTRTGSSGGSDIPPVSYDRLNPNGSMDVMGSVQNNSNTATAFSKNATNYSDYPGSNLRHAGGVAGAPATFGMSPGGSAPGHYEHPTPSKTGTNSRDLPGQQSKMGSPDLGVQKSIQNEFLSAGKSSTSDEKSKTEIGSGDSKMKELLNTIHAYEYSYKEPNKPGRGEGRFVSPMAQELEKTELGKSAVKETPDGKMVDYGKLLGTMLAGEAYLNERLNDLEGKKNSKPMTPPKKDRLK